LPFAFDRNPHLSEIDNIGARMTSMRCQARHSTDDRIAAGDCDSPIAVQSRRMFRSPIPAIASDTRPRAIGRLAGKPVPAPIGPARNHPDAGTQGVTFAIDRFSCPA
jgi:hypothetical protein